MPAANPFTKTRRGTNGRRTNDSAAARTNAADVARGELLGLPAHLLPQLPVAFRIGVQVHGFSGSIHIASRVCSAVDQRSGAGQSLSQSLWFDGDELRALAVAAQAERIWAADFKGYCLRKLHDPAFRVTEAIALDGAQPDSEPAGDPNVWTLGRVLRSLELELLTIEFMDAELASSEFTRSESAAA